MNSVTAIMTEYDDRFFEYISVGSLRSAAIVAPLVLQHYRAFSLADIGCGRGAWLVEWQRAGVADWLGVDGDYVDKDGLLVPADHFVAQDLTRCFDLRRVFDLVSSLEVGEHILPSATDIFVDNLCAHGDAILFSAAVPGQGGKSHVNEQTYDFWRQRFAARGYRLFDFVRPMLVSRAEVEAWYRYNILFFARGAAVERLSDEARATEITLDQPIPDFATLFWHLRNAVINLLPPRVVGSLVELKHQFARLRRC